MGHSNPRRASRELRRDLERLSKMTDEERRKERDAEELGEAKSLARQRAYFSCTAEERAAYTKVKDAMDAAESRAVNALYWDKEFAGTGQKNPWRDEQ